MGALPPNPHASCACWPGGLRLAPHWLRQGMPPPLRRAKPGFVSSKKALLFSAGRGCAAEICFLSQFRFTSTLPVAENAAYAFVVSAPSVSCGNWNCYIAGLSPWRVCFILHGIVEKDNLFPFTNEFQQILRVCFTRYPP